LGIRHIPSNSPYGVLDTRFAGRVGDNRWNQAGDPTFYIASDRSVALAEFARHFHERQNPTLASVAIERAVFELDVPLRAVLDLREPSVRTALGLRALDASWTLRSRVPQQISFARLRPKRYSFRQSPFLAIRRAGTSCCFWRSCPLI